MIYYYLLKKQIMILYIWLKVLMAPKPYTEKILLIGFYIIVIWRLFICLFFLPYSINWR